MAAEENTSWKQFKGRFADYPKGVRFIVFYHGGFGDYEQEGWWGTRMTGATVTVSFPKSNQLKLFKDGAKMQVDVLIDVRFPFLIT